MVITSISLFIYGIGTVTSLAMTYIEGARRGKDWDFYRVTGIVLCFFWPVLVPLLVLATACRRSVSRNGSRIRSRSAGKKPLAEPKLSRFSSSSPAPCRA